MAELQTLLDKITEILEKNSISEDVQTEIKDYVKDCVNDKLSNAKPKFVPASAPTPIVSASALAAVTKVPKVDYGICKGTLYKGTPKETDCTFKAKENGFCGRHNPDKAPSSRASTAGSTASVRSTRAAKAGGLCNATVSKTNKQCSQVGTQMPEGAKMKYCSRHAKDWPLWETGKTVPEDLLTEDALITEETSIAESNENASATE